MSNNSNSVPNSLWAKIPPSSLNHDPEGLLGAIPANNHLITAKRALLAGYQHPQVTQKISAALADFRHLCDAIGLDFATLDHAAYLQYLADRDRG